ncbi:uncharacterized protein TRIVIDRAFT_154462 [Trichoderma virens Gv29-8]|uniref:Uncharacterized protein n=1 Tax=Hypocrea virens (strain Gv29-8 / FGSC 10586) TaxID=413071 RepID=G9MY69_HYPVG|nr:uncharacterized protein TRIVIDRAFT_154462 [Trichoderma virens Gv29-8]EHK20491.1 hypothetical protein TRIVIDRAFT_154462 [Trichoderma virens Gv29-8]UKZ52952.1 hypothetical protein TrVGV298_006738 [Trichoderma virens]
MLFIQIFLAAAVTVPVIAAKVPKCTPFPSTMIEYSSGFKQPKPPLVQPEFTTNFVQHKWDETLSHIMTGYIDNSPAKGIVRVNEAYDDAPASSVFNYANVTKDGLVDNVMTIYNGTKPYVWQGYVNSNYPIFEQDFLVKNDAVFGGLVTRQFTEGSVASWNIMYQGAIPVTIYVNTCNEIVGYDYFSPGRRTRVVTDFFNIQIS